MAPCSAALIKVFGSTDMLEICHIVEVEPWTSSVDAVVFDLDDTLYAEKDYVRSGYAAVAKEFPEIPCMEQKLWKVFVNGGKAIDQVLSDAGLMTEENHARALHAYRFHRPTIELYVGAAEMLSRLRKKGKKLGIITDGRPEGQRAKLDALRLRSFVDEIIITDELGGVDFRKPNETAFRIMRERLNVPFEKMMYVGDNLKKDFVAPQALGMQCCYHRAPDGLYTRS